MLLLNRRLLTILVLGFSSGLPLALVGSTLQAWFTAFNIDVITIGALSLLGIPYAFKLLWAPLMDHFSFPFLDKRRGWIASMQVGLIIGVFLLAQLNPSHQVFLMSIVALVIAFFSASQDVVITAYQTDILPESERGLGASYYIFAYRLAALLSGGLALVFADYVGWKLTYELMGLFLLLSLPFTIIGPHVPTIVMPATSFIQTTKNAIKDILQRDQISLLILFVILYKTGDALALQLMTNFLLHGLGFSLTEVGLAYKTVSFIATILGAFLGGVLLTQLPIYRALLWFGIAQAFSNLMFVLLAVVGKHFLLMTAAIFVENFCSGLSTAALLAFMMSLCNRRYTASQFAFFSTCASLARVFLGPLAGVMVQNIGWVQFYLWTFFLCFPGIICLILLKEKVMCHAHAIID